MSKLTFTSPRATLEETLELANRVREAGGGNPLDALMPAVPRDPAACLIAKNLNFNCRVVSTDHTGTWVMYLDNKATRDAIAEALDLEPFDEPFDAFTNLQMYDDDFEVVALNYGVVLPDEIGRVAADFDEWSMAIVDPNYRERSERYTDILKTFSPYVEESVLEAMIKGELVL